MRRAVVLALLVVAVASSAGPEIAVAGTEVVAARPSADGPQADRRPCRTKQGHSRKCVTWKCRSAWKRACRMPRRAHEPKAPKATTIEKARIFSRRLRS